MTLLADIASKPPSLVVLHPSLKWRGRGDAGRCWHLQWPGRPVSIPSSVSAGVVNLYSVPSLKSIAAVWTFWDECLEKPVWDNPLVRQVVLKVWHRACCIPLVLKTLEWQSDQSGGLTALPSPKQFRSCTVNCHTAYKNKPISTFHGLSYLISHLPLWSRHYSFPHFTCGETSVQN